MFGCHEPVAPDDRWSPAKWSCSSHYVLQYPLLSIVARETNRKDPNEPLAICKNSSNGLRPIDLRRTMDREPAGDAIALNDLFRIH